MENKKIFEHFFETLRNQNKLEDIVTDFLSHSSMDDMFDYIWQLEEANEYIKLETHFVGKDKTEAENARKIGNSFYSKRNYCKAAEYYNKSINLSPQFIKDDSSLSFGFANRSALLYEIGQFNESIIDMDRALQNGYPLNMKYKLFERKVKCLIALQRITEAKDYIGKCLFELNKSHIENSKLQAMKQNLENLDTFKVELKKLNGKKSNGCKSLYLDFQNPVAPPVQKPHPFIPALTSAVDLHYTATLGRHLIANTDILPGEVIISEESYCSVLTDVGFSHCHHCSYCFRCSINPIPCSTCSTVMFCNETCYEAGMRTFHSVECPIISTLFNLDLGSIPSLALRIVVNLGIDELCKQVTQCREERQNCFLGNAGFNPKREYLSHDYRTVYNLVTNKEATFGGDVLRYCLQAFILVKLLLMSQKYFVGDEQKIMSDISICGSTLLLHMMNLSCNSHSVVEMAVDKNNHTALHNLGIGTFPVMSLGNHSCNPTARHFNYGPVIVMRAITYIPKGTEVTDTYGQHFALHPFEDRQKHLNELFYFTCICDACRDTWPVYDQLPDEAELRCPSCRGGLINISANKCFKCNVKPGELKYNFQQMFSELKMHEGNFLQNFITFGSENKAGLLPTNISDGFIQGISFISKYSMPCKTLFALQQTMKLCYDKEAWMFKSDSK